MKAVIRAGLLAAALACAGTLSAYSVQPMIYTLSPTGTGAVTRLTVANSRDAVLNVEVEPYRVVADEDGKRTFTPAPEDFVIFPPQSSIPPDRNQVFQVRYTGPADLETGRTYVLRVRQTNTIELAPQDTGEAANSKLSMSINFNTTAIVQPRAFEPNLVVEKNLAPGADGALHARLRNDGRGVADLGRATWQVVTATGREDIPVDTVKYGDAVFLDPGASREIILGNKPAANGRLEVRPAGGNRGRAPQ